MTEPRTKAGRALGQLLGRHHRQLMVSGEKCSACRDYHPTPKEVRAAIEREAAQQERERIRAAVEHMPGAVTSGPVWAYPEDVIADVLCRTSFGDFSAATMRRIASRIVGVLHREGFRLGRIEE